MNPFTKFLILFVHVLGAAFVVISFWVTNKSDFFQLMAWMLWIYGRLLTIEFKLDEK